MADEVEENEQDRRAQYRKLRKGGMLDKEANEKVWPTTGFGFKKNELEKEGRKEERKKAAEK